MKADAKNIRKNREVSKMGLGAMMLRGAVIIGGGALLYMTALNPIMDRISSNNAVVEQGYVNPKSLSIQGKKNASGNIEAYLQYKNGDETISLPCTKAPNGPLCGAMDYWWTSIGQPARERLVVEEWPGISSEAKRGVIGVELERMLEFYGQQNKPQKQPQQQYNARK